MTSTRAPGQELYLLRKAKQLTQEEVAERSNGVLVPQAISRLENDRYKRPSMIEAIAYGKILGLTPNDLAKMYGYWEDPGELSSEPIDIARARSVAMRLPDGPVKDELLSWIRFAVAHAQARAKAGER